MTPALQSAATRDLCDLAPVIPVLVVHDAAQAGDLGRALIAGGTPVLEVTLRSAAALDVIRAMAELPGGHVGAGTVLNRDDVMRARDAGATFAVSPGLTEALARAAEEAALPLLPGAVTASEAMRAAEMGYDMLKFFPAESAGGAAALKSLAGPLPRLSFCPTGGITPATAPDYLSLPNVRCVGGSWLVTADALASADWTDIQTRASQARALARRTE